MIDSRQEAYEKIIRRAIPLANADTRLPFWLKGHYKPPNHWETLAVEWRTEEVISAIAGARKHYRETRTDDEIMEEFVQVAVDAVQRAIRMEPDALGYLMLEEIRFAALTRKNGTI